MYVSGAKTIFHAGECGLNSIHSGFFGTKQLRKYTAKDSVSISGEISGSKKKHLTSIKFKKSTFYFYTYALAFSMGIIVELK